jgi:hypothetical protein
MWEMKGFFSNLVDSVLDALEVVMHVAYETGKAVLWIGTAAALLVGFFAGLLEASQHSAIAVRVLAWGLISLASLAIIIPVTLLLLWGGGVLIRGVWRARPTRNGKMEAEQRAEREKIQSEYDRTHRYRGPWKCGNHLLLDGGFGDFLPESAIDAAKPDKDSAWSPVGVQRCVNCGLGLKSTRAQMNENGEPVHLNCSLTTGYLVGGKCKPRPYPASPLTEELGARLESELRELSNAPTWRRSTN